MALSRYVIIGDIHGMLGALEELLDRVGLRDDDVVVFVGDLMDRGPDSAGVVRRVRELAQDYDVTLIKGNHEAKHERYRRARAIAPDHSSSVRGARELESITRALDPVDLAFLETAVLWYRIAEHDALVVHGGIPPRMELLPGTNGDGSENALFGPTSLTALDSENRAWAEQMLRVRWVRGQARVELVVQGGLPLGRDGGGADAPSVGDEVTVTGRVLRRDFRPEGEYLPLGTEGPDDPYWADIYDGRFGQVYFGHNPFTGRTEPVRFANATALDLGAVYGGHLAAAILEAGREPRYLTVATTKATARRRTSR
jgi:hypothetical protein